MSHNLARIFNDFHAAILERDSAHATPDIKPHPRMTPQQQLAIYIDGYRIRLIAAIRADYPALLALLGNAAFDALARDYSDAHPPTHFNLDRYPHGFAAFLTTQPLDDFARDVAHTECAIAQVFMLPDSMPLAPASLARLDPASFGNMVLAPRTACRLLALGYDVDHYLTTQRDGENMAMPAPHPTYLCLLRHENEVKRHALTPAAYRLLGHLFTGQPVATAIEAAIADAPGDAHEITAHLQPWFVQWLQVGFFRAEIPDKQDCITSPIC